MTRVVVCGGLTIDWLQTSAGRFGPSLGGNAAYAAVGAWLAGARPEVVGVVGDDYPTELLDELREAEIDVAAVRTSPGPSFRVLLDERGPRRTISYLPGSGNNDRLDPVPSQLPPIDSQAGVHICGIPVASQRELIHAIARRAGTVTLDTVVIPGEISPRTRDLLAVARDATVFMPSRDEVEHHWPGGVNQALEELAKAGCASVVVKLGAQGSVARAGARTWSLPAVSTDVVDPIGAGDAYCGAVCARLTMGDDLRTAMAWGAAAASIVIEGHGAARALRGGAQALTTARAEELSRPESLVT
jgi:ribokinase